MRVDGRALDDLVTFARIEVESGDLEPWAAVLAALAEPEDRAYWLVKLYNAYDDLGSAVEIARRWPTPEAWADAPDRDGAAEYPCTQERRGLRGGRVLQHLDSYVKALGPFTQREWIGTMLMGDDPEHDFVRVTTQTRAVWGVGRQTAFEWAEFLAKVCRVPITAPDAQLWESEGPRRSLQSLYGNPKPTRQWLSTRAVECRAMLADHGVPLAWEDFETVICDFHVMRAGRYYPGRHLAALREEIDLTGADRDRLLTAWRRAIP